MLESSKLPRRRAALRAAHARRVSVVGHTISGAHAGRRGSCRLLHRVRDNRGRSAARRATLRFETRALFGTIASSSPGPPSSFSTKTPARLLRTRPSSRSTTGVRHTNGAPSVPTVTGAIGSLSPATCCEPRWSSVIGRPPRRSVRSDSRTRGPMPPPTSTSAGFLSMPRIRHASMGSRSRNGSSPSSIAC